MALLHLRVVGSVFRMFAFVCADVLFACLRGGGGGGPQRCNFLQRRHVRAAEAGSQKHRKDTLTKLRPATCVHLLVETTLDKRFVHISWRPVPESQMKKTTG